VVESGETAFHHPKPRSYESPAHDTEPASKHKVKMKSMRNSTNPVRIGKPTWSNILWEYFCQWVPLKRSQVYEK
jgi:hypothetical protein